MELRLDNLTKEFEKFTAVNHINLTLTNGVYGLLGVNGAGKTTLMRMLSSVVTASVPQPKETSCINCMSA